MMKTRNRPLLLAGLATILLGSSAIAADHTAERSPPDYEYFVVIQRIDLPAGTIHAGGESYHLRPDSEIWIDERLAQQEELNAAMHGLQMGIRSYEEGGQQPIRSLHIFTQQDRASPVNGAQQ